MSIFDRTPQADRVSDEQIADLETKGWNVYRDQGWRVVSPWGHELFTSPYTTPQAAWRCVVRFEALREVMQKNPA
jgi:hypothetical protein